VEEHLVRSHQAAHRRERPDQRVQARVLGVYSVREEMPLHYALAKQVHSYLAREANAEETFSLSGKLSDPNVRGDPGFLERRTRINKNRSVYTTYSKSRATKRTCDGRRKLATS